MRNLKNEPLKKITLISTLLFNFTFLIGQTYSSIISDKEIYDFLNWMTKNDRKYGDEPKFKRKQIDFLILPWDTCNFVIKDSAVFNNPNFVSDHFYLFYKNSRTDLLLQQQDREFIFKQFTEIKDTIWHKPFSNSKLLINKDQKKPNRYYYSIPLFSVDKKYVIIHRQYYCGNLCAYGGYYVYQRLDEKKWEYVTAVHSWIS